MCDLGGGDCAPLGAREIAKCDAIGGFQRGASGVSCQKEDNQRDEETKRGKRKVERDQKDEMGHQSSSSLGPVRPVVWRTPHEPWIKVRLATSVEPLNFVFVSQIDGLDLGGVQMSRRWLIGKPRVQTKILPRYLITGRGEIL